MKWKSPAEYKECLAYFKWCCMNPILKEYLIKNVNEGKRSAASGYFLNLIGMRAGIPDYHLPYSNKKYHGLWIEMKKADGKNKKKDKNQEEWIEKLLKIGHYASYAYGWEDASLITVKYLNDSL